MPHTQTVSMLDVSLATDFQNGGVFLNKSSRLILYWPDTQTLFFPYYITFDLQGQTVSLFRRKLSYLLTTPLQYIFRAKIWSKANIIVCCLVATLGGKEEQATESRLMMTTTSSLSQRLPTGGHFKLSNRITLNQPEENQPQQQNNVWRFERTVSELAFMTNWTWP
jgi:hypothetical protein